MKIDSEELTVEKIGFESNEKKFTINANAEAFKLLSSKIYSNNIRACIRELSVNSFDAHVAAGNLSIPFEVNLPNALLPRFRIRDFGTGLSEEDIYGIYTTYCLSDKISSNSYVGQLGIGSKSPFSYCDQYSVISYFNGEKLTFSSFISSDGCPSIILLEKEKTSEPNGLEVSFAVNRNDFDKFAREAKFVYSLWEPIKPKITGNRITLDEFIPAMTGTDWQIGGNIQQNYAVMGNVTYNLSYNSLTGDDYEIKYNSTYHKLLTNNKVIVWFNIGDLDITASREELSYSKKTIKNVKDKIATIYKEVKERLENEIVKNAKNYLEACTYYAQNISLYRSFGLDSGLEFGGKKIEYNIPLKDYNNNWKEIIPGLSVKKLRNRRSKTLIENEIYEISLPAVFYRNDIKNGLSNLRYEFLNGQLLKGKNVYTIDFTLPTAEKEFLDYLGTDSSIFQLTSSLPATPKNPRRAAKTIQCYEWDNGWSPTTIDLTNITDIFSFIKLFRFEIEDREFGKISKFEFSSLLKSLENLGIGQDTIVGLRQNPYNKVQGMSNWRPFGEIVNESFDNYIKINKLEDVLPHLIINEKNYYNLLENYWRDFKKGILCPKMQKVFNLIELMHKHDSKAESIIQINKFLKKENKSNLQIQSVNDLFDELISESYPMLEFVKNNNYYYYCDKEIDYVKRIINYVNFTYTHHQISTGIQC